MRNTQEDKPIICNIECRNFETCANKISENFKKSFDGYCAPCTISGMSGALSLDEIDEIKTIKRRSNRELY